MAFIYNSNHFILSVNRRYKCYIWPLTMRPRKQLPRLNYGMIAMMLIKNCWSLTSWTNLTINLQPYNVKTTLTCPSPKPQKLYNINQQYVVPTFMLSEYPIFCLSLLILVKSIYSIIVLSDMDWNPKWDFNLYYCPFCSENMTKV